MKIISFAVNNFRGISGGLDNNRIIFNNSDTIFIFGQNNVGKSTFLLAYDFLYSNKNANEDDFYEKKEQNNIEFELEVCVDNIDLDYINKIQGKKKDSFAKYLSNENMIKIRRTISIRKENDKIRIDNPNDITYNPKEEKWDNIAFGSIGLSTVFQYLLPTPILIKAMPTEEEVEKVINDILASKAKRRLDDKEFGKLKEAQNTIRELQEKMYNTESIERYKNEVNAKFGKLFPDVEIDLIDKDKVKWTEDKFGKKFEVEFHKKDNNGIKRENVPTSYNTIGHGAIRTAIFSLLLMRDIAEEMERVDGRKEYLILFEEPELFLHPKIMKILRDLIYLVSENDYPYQILCASHSSQMIDISKNNSSLVRMVRQLENTTKLFQITNQDFADAKDITTKTKLRQELFEILRFNPYICESFYADEILLVEGPTEEIIIRGILQEETMSKDLFIVNCNTVNNIPFYQKVYTRFSIKHHIICDTDNQIVIENDKKGNPVFDSGIQGSICALMKDNDSAGLLRIHNKTFEPAHREKSINEKLRLPDYIESDGKPFNANRYWREILEPNYSIPEINTVPIIKNVKEIIEYIW